MEPLSTSLLAYPAVGVMVRSETRKKQKRSTTEAFFETVGLPRLACDVVMVVCVCVHGVTKDATKSWVRMCW